jgi:hypothetical protein
LVGRLRCLLSNSVIWRPFSPKLNPEWDDTLFTLMICIENKHEVIRLSSCLFNSPVTWRHRIAVIWILFLKFNFHFWNLHTIHQNIFCQLSLSYCFNTF